MFEIIWKIFILLLSSIVNASNHKKCVRLSNQKCETRLTHINLHPNQYSQEFDYYPFLVPVRLDWRAGSCNTLNELSNEIFVPNKTEDLSLSMFNMIT